MSITQIDIKNPSPSAAMRIASEDRAPLTLSELITEARVRNFNDAGPTPEERQQLLELGAETVTVRSKDAFGAREVQMPRWQASGFSHPNEFVTRGASMKHDAPVAQSSAKPVRVTDDWNSARPLDAVAAHGTIRLTLTDSRRFAMESDSEFTLTISNPSRTNALRLRLRDKAGKISNIGIIHPTGTDAASITVPKGYSGIIEQLFT